MSFHLPEEIQDTFPARRTVKESERSRNAAAGDRTILHVDMDAFFASVEQRDNPHLQGRPVIVGSIPGGRGVVATCSYEARVFGVRSGMPLAEAVKRCPHGEYIKPSGRKYTFTAHKLIDIYYQFTPVVEPVSIDEAYLDITGCTYGYGDPEKLALALKKDIYSLLRLTCSVGIAHNRIFSKIASELNKPDGLTIITKDDIPAKVFPLPVAKIWGIGKKTTKTLREIGIVTIGDLAHHPEDSLKARFGTKNGERLKKAALGEPVSGVVDIHERRAEKSIGHEYTFDTDIADSEKIESMLLKLSQKVGRRLRKRGFSGRTVTLKLRYADFETHTHQNTLHRFICGDREIYNAGKILLRQRYQQARSVRLIGISVSHIIASKSDTSTGVTQIDLFDGSAHPQTVLPVIDNLRDRYGETIISRVGTLGQSLR